MPPAARQGRCTCIQPRMGRVLRSPPSPPAMAGLGLEGFAISPHGMHPPGSSPQTCTRCYRLSPTYLNSFSSTCHLQWGEKAGLRTVGVGWGHIQFLWQKYCSKGSTAGTPMLPLLPQLINLYSSPLPFLLYLVSPQYQSDPQICAHTSDLAASHTQSDSFVPPGSSPDLSLCFLCPHKPRVFLTISDAQRILPSYHPCSTSLNRFSQP